MEYLIICLAAIIGSALTLFSGFGLGTILVPVFALFFPVEVAIALTAIVHFLNNLFKLVLLGKDADRTVILRFGIPALIAAFIGAGTLLLFTDMLPIYQYSIYGKTFSILPVKLVVAILMVVFAIADILPGFEKITIDKKYLPVGGFLSGFFGGLSGNQGALRSMFLIKAGLSKETYIATGVWIAVLIDMSRITVYSNMLANMPHISYRLLISATLCAFAGAYIGSKLIKKITISALRTMVAFMLLIIAVLLGMGII